MQLAYRFVLIALAGVAVIGADAGFSAADVDMSAVPAFTGTSSGHTPFYREGDLTLSEHLQ